MPDEQEMCPDCGSPKCCNREAESIESLVSEIGRLRAVIARYPCTPFDYCPKTENGLIDRRARRRGAG